MSAHQAVLFDCDGVLVNSEPLTMRVLRDLLSARGWDMPLTECMRRFVGKATRDEATLIEARTGQPLTQAWLDYFWAERDKVLRSCLTAGISNSLMCKLAATCIAVGNESLVD